MNGYCYTLLSNKKELALTSGIQFALYSKDMGDFDRDGNIHIQSGEVDVCIFLESVSLLVACGSIPGPHRGWTGSPNSLGWFIKTGHGQMVWFQEN